MRLGVMSVIAGMFAWACSGGGADADGRAGQSHYTSDDLNSALALLREEPDNLDANRAVWSYYTETGRYDALVEHAEPVFRRSYNVAGKERLAFTSGAFISQAYVFMEKLDSVAIYLERIMPFADDTNSDDLLKALTHNIAAIYLIKNELNYSAALEQYEVAYSIMERKGHTINQSTLLCNIASIYVSLRDSTGFEYARNAYEISHSDKSATRSYPQVFSTILLAQMYYLRGDFNEALHYADEAAKEVAQFPQFVSSLDLLYADIALESSDYRKAEFYYRKALAGEKDTEPGVNAVIYLRYGTMLSSMHRWEEAADILHRGLDVNSLEFRHELLAALSDVAMRQGRDKEALDYYKEYHAWQDSVSYIQKERAFQQYRLLVKDNEIQSRELDLLKANRRIIIIVAVSALILILAVALWVVNRRRNRMYRRMVEVHQQLLSRIDMRAVNGEGEAESHEKDDRDMELWKRLDQLMSTERAYRYSDISLDKIAEILATNRAYVSRVINKYSGKSFYNYIHTQRIEDASRMLSDVSNDISLKALTFDLGYNSISSFYRAFLKETGVPPSKYREEVLRIKQDATS